MSKKIVFHVPTILLWDKLCALYLQCALHFGDRFESLREAIDAGLASVHFDGEPDCPTGSVDLEIVDVDVVRPYAMDEVGSATAAVVKKHGFKLQWPGLDRLVSLLDTNNVDGDLRNFADSLVWLIRELSILDDGVPDPHGQKLEVIYQMWPAVTAYFDAAEVKELPVRQMKNPFTLANFQVLCEIAGWIELTIHGHVETIRSLCGVARNREAEAELSAATIENVQFDVPSAKGPLIGRYIQTKNSRVAAAYLRQHNEVVLLVCQRPDNGKAAIFCRGQQDFGPMHEVLRRLEPDRWYLNTKTQSPSLLNGSDSRPATPSELGYDDFVWLVQEHYVHKSRTWKR